MRILYVTGEYPPMRGGIGDYTARLASTIVSEGHDVAVLTSAQAEGATTPGVQLLPHVTSWGFASWREITAVAQKFDLLHLQYQAGAFEMRLATQFLPDVVRLTVGKPVVTTFHDLRVPYLFPKAGRFREWSIRHLARASDGVVVTNGEDDVALRERGVSPLWQIPLAPTLSLEAPADWDREVWRAAYGVEAGHKLLVHFGFINRSKDLRGLLQAQDGLLRAGQPVHLLMLGDTLGASDPTNAAYYYEIQSWAAELKLEPPWLQWTGDLPEQEVVKGLLAADLVVLPYTDGASLRRTTLIAALALGRPVLTTEPTTTIPLLQEGRNIAYARRNDPGDLARRVALLVRYEPTLRRLERGASELTKAFDWDAVARQHLAMYRSLLAGLS